MTLGISIQRFPSPVNAHFGISNYRLNETNGEWLKGELNKLKIYPFVFCHEPSIRFYQETSIAPALEALKTMPEITIQNTKNTKGDHEFILNRKGKTVKWLIGTVTPHNLHGG